MTKPRRSADDTRQAILAAARELFARDGFDRATIRSIAARAACDPAVVMRHFGTKRGLFAEAIETPLALLPDAPADGPADLEALAGTLLSAWHKDQTFISLMRAAGTDRRVAQNMREFFETRVRHQQLRTMGLPPEEAVCFGVMLAGLAWGREIVRIEPLASMGSEELAAIVGRLLGR